MRTQFLFVGLLSLMAGGLGSTGCDDIHTGQGSDPSGPVKLIRVIVQEPSGDRGLITDLLDTTGSPLSTAVACDVDLNPCQPAFTLDGNNPDFSCVNSACNDPLAPGPVGVSSPTAVGPNQIRLVFNKLLDVTTLETVTIDETKLPGHNATYKFQDGVVELDGPNGAVAVTAYWDPTGSANNTSDPINIPYGPAIVFSPDDGLALNTTYTVKLTTAAVFDRKQNPMADQFGAAVPSVYTITFTTENLVAGAAIPPIDPATGKIKAGSEIKPDAILQVSGFNADVDEKTITCTATDAAGAAVTVKAYNDRGADPTKCMKALDPKTVDIVAVDAAGAAIDWAAGTYNISCTFHDAYTLGAGSFTYEGSFTVTGTPDAMDPQSRANHVLPAVCTG